MTNCNVEIRPYSSAIGAEIHGVDLAQPLDNKTWATIHDAFHRHLVLFFRDQELTPGQQVKFSRRFGELVPYPFVQGIDGFPELIDVVKMPDEVRNFGAGWHADMSFSDSPPLGAVLYAIEVPPVGGDTLFASMSAAYEALSAPMKTYLENLTATHDGERVWRGRYSDQGIDDSDTGYPRAVHPVIRTHPITGQKGIFVNSPFTTHINEIPRDESDDILAFLYKHCAKPDFQVRFRWQPNSVAFWDNRCVQHLALWDYFPETRSGYRVTIEGDRPI